MDAVIKAIKLSDGTEVNVKATDGGALLTAEQRMIWTAKGYGYQARTTSAVAAVVDEPTTTALFTLWNGESGGGKVYVIEGLMANQDVSGAAASRWTLFACVHPVNMAAVTADITKINSTRGIANYGGNARLDVGATVVDDGWYPVANSQDVEATGTLGGAGLFVPVNGTLIIPPTAAISLHVYASSVDEDFNVGFKWFEVPQSELAME